MNDTNIEKVSIETCVLQNNEVFFWYEVDREIQKNLGFETMDEIAAWTGDPSDEGFEKREQEYLKQEEQFVTYF